jgi:hypothetical protein
MDAGASLNSGAAVVAGQGHQRLSLAEARRSPCMTCSTSPCCTHLPIHSFTMTTMMDLDNALYLLNFDGIRLGLSASGEWSVYYGRPCRFLDRRDATCTIHGTDRQPNICATYNPYSCWYRRVFSQPGDEFVWVDRPRLERLAEQVVFDEFRTIVEVPSWESLVAEAAPPPPPPSAPTAVSLTLGPTRLRSRPAPAEEEQEQHSFDDLRTPCASCTAYCCTTLVFPKPRPSTNVQLDYWRFCLGFPGIEVGIGKEEWSLLISTTCRHLDDANRCSVYGQPERPLRCSYYDAWKCGYKPRLGPVQQPGFRRMDLDAFDEYLADLVFDAAGAVT